MFFHDDDNGDDLIMAQDFRNTIKIRITTKRQKEKKNRKRLTGQKKKKIKKRDFFTRTWDFLISSFFTSDLAHCISMPYLSNSKFITLPSYSLVSN